MKLYKYKCSSKSLKYYTYGYCNMYSENISRFNPFNCDNVFFVELIDFGKVNVINV